MTISSVSKTRRSGTFVDNMKLPVHRWFRFSAGFSAEWAENCILDSNLNSENKLLDPFAGSGTSLLASDSIRVPSIGIEAHPFIARITKAKLLYDTPVYEFDNKAHIILEHALSGIFTFNDNYPILISKCFTDETLIQLDKLKQSWIYHNDNTAASELVWLAINSILRSTSFAGTAQWQYILPNKIKKIVLDPYKAFQAQIQMMENDMRMIQLQYGKSLAQLIPGDSRHCSQVESNSIDLVITSPPYANNYDYADATRLEMSFWGDIDNWGQLQGKVRKNLIVSSSQHASLNKIPLETILNREPLSPIRSELSEICARLASERFNHGGKKHYHTMIASYFSDMADIWIELRRMCKQGSRLYFIIGDSAPYGIYVPVDHFLGELAIHAGFTTYKFMKLRDRNIKWKNRKHRVPLNEGILYVTG